MVLFEKQRGPLSTYQYVDIRFDNVLHGPRIQLVGNELGRR
jgi:hypothetical protein